MFGIISDGGRLYSSQMAEERFSVETDAVTTLWKALSVIIGLIGIVNFINSVLTSIITRQKEFAMLQSIGMTGKQQKQMLGSSLTTL